MAFLVFYLPVRRFGCCSWGVGFSLHSYWSIGVAPVRGNALNLSPTASSEFVREMEVGLGFSGRSGV